MSSASLRDEEKILLVTILKGVSASQMNFDRVGADMGITKRAASERWQRLRTKLWGKKEFSMREEDKSLLLVIMKGLTNADMDFERVGDDMGITKRAASERYARLKTKLWGNRATSGGSGGGVSSSPPAARSSSAGPVRPQPRKAKEKEVNYQEDEGGFESDDDDDDDMEDRQDSDEDESDGADNSYGHKATVKTSASRGHLYKGEYSRYQSPSPETPFKGEKETEDESEDEFHDAPQVQENDKDVVLSDVEY